MKVRKLAKALVSTPPTVAMGLAMPAANARSRGETAARRREMAPMFVRAIVAVILTVYVFGCASGQDASGCRGPGRYAATKDVGRVPCCSGLHEVSLSNASPGYGANGVPVCFQPPAYQYVCERGRCGDGICEPGEAPACGCVADCPDAAWGDQDADAD
jgi:hypothetical protein